MSEPTKDEWAMPHHVYEASGLPIEDMDPAECAAQANAANGELACVTDDKEVLGSPRFAFLWGFIRGVKWQQGRGQAACGHQASPEARAGELEKVRRQRDSYHQENDRLNAAFVDLNLDLAAAEARLKEAEGYLRSWFEQGEVCPVCSQDPHGYGCSLAAFLAG